MNRILHISTGALCVLLLMGTVVTPTPATAQQPVYTTTSMSAGQAYLLAQLELIVLEILKIQVLIDALRAAEGEEEADSVSANTELDIVTIAAQIDYVADTTTVTTKFTGDESETFTLTEIETEEIEEALQDRYDLSSRELDRVLEVSEINAAVLVGIVVEMNSSRSISITQVAANDDEITQQIPGSVIDAFIENDFDGLGNVYDELVDGYAREIRGGDIPDGVVGLVADLMRLPVSTVEPIIEFDVSRSYRSNANS